MTPRDGKNGSAESYDDLDSATVGTSRRRLLGMMGGVGAVSLGMGVGAGDANPISDVLVDASRDDGFWWYPQTAPFDPEEGHQGKPLVDYLNGREYSVTELPRSEDTTIDLDQLKQYRMVIRAGGLGRPYSPSERDAYEQYVRDGGRVLLLSNFLEPDETDSLASSFGLTFRGISRGENIIDDFADHPIAEGVSNVSYMAGSGLTEYPEEATIVGRLSSETYLDLDNDEERDPDEPTGSPVLGTLTLGDGRIVFLGDIITLETVPQPLTKNITEYLFANREEDALDRADQNGDMEISTSELDDAIRGWARGDYTTEELQRIIRAWASS